MNQRDVIKLAREAGFQMENTAAIQAAEKLAAAVVKHYVEHCVTELTGLPYTVPALMVDMTPPATSRDRWMYEQGRLAERDPRSHVAQLEPVELTDDQIEDILGAAYSKLVAETGYNGGMGGKTWDIAAARAVLAAAKGGAV